MLKKYLEKEKLPIIAQIQQGKSIAQISLETGIARSTIYSWLNKISMPTTPEGKFITLREVNRLRHQLEKYHNMVQILHTVNCTVHSSNQEKLAALETLYGQYDVHTLCEALKVPRGTFYNHIFRGKHGDTINARRREELRTVIYDIFHEYEQLFGAGKITAILRERGYCTSEKLVTELMGEMGLKSVSSSAKRMYYKWQKGENKNILQQRFHVTDPNKVWVSDVTAFKYRDTYYYIAAIIDLFSRKVIAYKVSKQNSTQVVTSVFRAAYHDRSPESGLVFHSDRGAQYTSLAFSRLTHSCKVEQSFSKSRCPHDNAVMESFFASLKKEELYRRTYFSEKDFFRGIDRYVAFYNEKRPHGAIHYKTPNAFEEEHNSRII